jgi:hypothetical protein
MDHTQTVLNLIKEVLEFSTTQEGALGYLNPEKYAHARLDGINEESEKALKLIAKVMPLNLPENVDKIIKNCLFTIKENMTDQNAVAYYKSKQYAARRFDSINTQCEEALIHLTPLIEPINNTKKFKV